MSTNEKRDRLIEAATALLAEAEGRRLKTTNLNKALFYIDLACLRDFGETLTHNSFVALKEGPVIAKYRRRLIETLKAAGFAQQDDERSAKPIVLISQPPVRHITAEVTELIRRVARWCSRKTAKQISDFSHQNPGWARAYESGLGAGGPAQPINLTLAMQQILDDDPWLAEPLDKEAQEALTAADQDVGIEW